MTSQDKSRAAFENHYSHITDPILKAAFYDGWQTCEARMREEFHPPLDAANAFFEAGGADSDEVRAIFAMQEALARIAKQDGGM